MIRKHIKFGSFFLEIRVGYLHSKLWRPPLFYRLCHPRTWRKTQAAAIALMSKQQVKGGVTLLDVGRGSVTGYTLTTTGSGYYSTPPSVTISPPASNP